MNTKILILFLLFLFVSTFVFTIHEIQTQFIEDSKKHYISYNEYVNYKNSFEDNKQIIEVNNINVSIYTIQNKVYEEMFNSIPDADNTQLSPFLITRMFQVGTDIFIDEEAYFITKKDYENTLKHEIGHTEGKGYNLLGIMSPFFFIRGF